MNYFDTSNINTPTIIFYSIGTEQSGFLFLLYRDLAGNLLEEGLYSHMLVGFRFFFFLEILCRAGLLGHQFVIFHIAFSFSITEAIRS